MRLRSLLVPTAVAMLLVQFASDAGAQDRRVRFVISEPADTLFHIAVGSVTWLRDGMTGIVVDPRDGDALVARFRVAAVRNGVASAVVTGQTMRVTTSHMALLEEPKRSWFQQLPFWAGGLIGVAVGVLIAKG